MKEIDSTLKKIMATVLKTDESYIDANSSADSLENWDSLNHLNLILAIEEEFEISFPETEVADLSSFKLLKCSIEEQLA